MFTYGYIREATMARLDIDETEAEAMHLLERFHIYANEAMQAICASKPMYQYIDVTVVEKYAPLVWDGAFLRPATDEEIHWDKDTQGEPEFEFATEEETQEYYHEKNIYQQFETMYMKDTFIAFANKQAYIVEVKKPTIPQILEAEAFGKELKEVIVQKPAIIDQDFSYMSKNSLKFYKTGEYMIPAKFMWYRFDSGISDEQEIEMPSDIFLTIPIYIASICYQIDNPQKAQVMRNEFEMALARCTATDFMTLNKIGKSW